MFQEVGIFNAKVGLSELPHAIQEERQRYTIAIRGESVADLVPSGATKQRDVHAAVAAHAGIPENTRCGEAED